MTERARPGGRAANQLRALSAEYGLLRRADGSAQLFHGETGVLAGLFGPGPPRAASKERGDRARLSVSLRPAVGLPSPRDKAVEALVRDTLESSIRLTDYPGSLISLSLQVLADAGSLAAVALNAAALALLDAGVGMTGLPLACTVAVVDGAPALDPELAEEEAAEACATLAFVGDAGGVAASITAGRLASDTYLACAEAALRATRSELAFVRMSLS